MQRSLDVARSQATAIALTSVPGGDTSALPKKTRLGNGLKFFQCGLHRPSTSLIAMSPIKGTTVSLQGKFCHSEPAEPPEMLGNVHEPHELLATSFAAANRDSISCNFEATSLSLFRLVRCTSRSERDTLIVPRKA
ncbi:hypothetical protein FOQG_08044 [Fusarium oxysporum f. sp. raphani 54005]|uniref:Uncharacterized protein n=1 Tax=Fusarium oxysporum f. sp. raphani 54005 TaxID=1089458 RepID=X0C3P1_FUSOX|nr:hypothetical protein FOQG_08044 [Fusarium oxysporum f. sp. raphani 54005]